MPLEIIDLNEEKKDDVPKVKPLDNDGSAAARKTTDKPSSAKKSTIELKPKPEIKKPIVKNVEATTEAIATTQAIATNETPVSEKKVMVELPILVRGEPLIPTTAQNVAGVSTEATVLSTEAAPIVQSPRGRALNVSASEPGNTLQTNTTDLSDISMDDEDKEVKGGEYIAMHNATSLTSAMVSPLPTVAPSMCVDGNKTYAVGQKIQRGCDEWCRCVEGGKVTDCKPLTCTLPLVKTDETKNHDPLCHAQPLPEFPCCATLDCPDSAVESEESCIFGNTTIQRGQRVEDGCAKTCVCEEGGHLKCQPRCPPNDTASSINQHDRCVVLPDPSDSCCTITLCDVTLGDHEIKSEGPADLNVNLTDVKVLNSTSIKLKLSSKMSDDITVEISENNHVWRQVKPTKDGIITNLLPAHGYYVRIVENSRPGPAIHVSLLAEVTKTIAVAEKSEKGMCTHRGKSYKIGAEWYDDCIAVCFCNETAQTECVTIECPTDFGLDVLDPHCLDWETVPPNHVPKAPNCCPQEVLCRNNGSCTYEGKTYDNWSRLPTNVTGCEKECFCEFGNVTCNPACPPVPQLPPMSLNCKSHEAILTHLPGDDCCLHWACPQNALDLPGKNTKYIYPGPVAPDTDEKHQKDKSKQPSEKPTPSTPFQWPMAPTPTHPPQPAVPPNSDIIHYPMDPGHPTVPYVGPYNPDFKPTRPSAAEVFHLPSHTEKVSPPVKDKNKSKSESKKPVDTIKSHKDGNEFPGPLAPDRFPEKVPTARPNNPNVAVPETNNKLPGTKKGSQSEHGEQPQFIPLNVYDHLPGAGFGFAPTNGENIPTSHFDTLLENPAAGPSYGARPDGTDPNNVVPAVQKKKVSPETYPSEKVRPPHRPTTVNPYAHLPDGVYHVDPYQYPGLLEYDKQHPDHQEETHEEKPAKKKVKPQVYTQKDESGQTTYHVHAQEVPNTPQQLEELLAHVIQHDQLNPNNQHHGVNVPQDNEPPSQGPVIGLTHPQLGPHGFVAQVPPPGQSGFGQGLPPIGQFPPHGGYNVASTQTYEVAVEDLRAISANSVRLMFTVPSVLVGLHGRVEVRYTSDKSNSDPLSWKSQTFAPPGDLIDTEDLEFDLSGLKPSTLYRLMIVVKLRDLANTHTSKIYQVRTLDKPVANSTPAEITIDSELRILEINSTYAEFEWKKFSNYELQFIDGVYLMYRAENEKTYSVTPLLHKSVNHYVLDHLQPSTMYEVHLSTKDIIGQTDVLIDSKTVNFTTTAESDPYSFDVRVEIKTIKATEVEVLWSGVPSPQEKYVNIFRAVYQSDSGKEDTSTFKLAKKDAPAKTIIDDLKPGTRYRLWLEVYMTNGKIKKSNVQDFVTKPGVLLQGKLASVPINESDYYGPLVIVAIVATVSILMSLVLLMMLMKRRTSSKADISPRKTTSAYDNPSYKTCEEAVSNGHNKPIEHEMQIMNGNNGEAKETA
ncbi:putative epidermal cell surface receptor [Trichogramma pretiosum]|uniref:putative epidermal cell surface receptor n=1 Tax=Trichogramma pretiosum TaxID=7493 RepID=UPI0006C9B1AA|nr:putative epidermal cell surface receptor [Trichogramma pretiosum]